jgi:4-methyl-5(b-hydroxyethyl)-thiazole monophosphate biosynthesis
MSRTALILLAHGFEDLEAVAPIDVLNRVGVKVTVASLDEGPAEAAYGTNLVTDMAIDRVDGLFDAVVLPGGAGNAERLAAHPKVKQLILDHLQSDRIVAAICASLSLVLGEAAGILRGRKATGAPVYRDELAASGADVTDEPVTVDGNIITATGPGTALPFALRLAAELAGREKADELAARWNVSY